MGGLNADHKHAHISTSSQAKNALDRCIQILPPRRIFLVIVRNLFIFGLHCEIVSYIGSAPPTRILGSGTKCLDNKMPESPGRSHMISYQWNRVYTQRPDFDTSWKLRILKSEAFSKISCLDGVRTKKEAFRTQKVQRYLIPACGTT